MGKGGHGGGAVGGGHSHNEEYPDDNWNLYQHVDRAEALNAEGDATNVLRPFVRRLETEGSLVSDGDGTKIYKLDQGYHGKTVYTKEHYLNVHFWKGRQ